MSNLDLTVDLTYLNNIAGGDPEFMIEMIDMFITQTPIYISEMKTELDKQNWTGVGSVAHKLKPTLAFVGVSSVMDTIARIETNAKKSENLETIATDFELVSSSLPTLFANLEIEKAKLNS